MINKKGFTIIEIVVSFAIVALIAGIGMISYSSVFSNATEKYFHTVESSLVLSGSDYFEDHREKLSANSYSTVSISELMNENYTDDVKDQNGNLCLNGEVIVYKGDNNKYQYEVCLKCGGYKSSGKYCEGYDINAKRVKAPTSALCKSKNKATYTGEMMSLTIVDGSEGFEFKGTNYYQNANEEGHVITATLKEGYTWSDDSEEETKTFTCKLYKKTPSILIDPHEGIVAVGHETMFIESAETLGTFRNVIENNSIAEVRPESQQVKEGKVFVKGKELGKSTNVKITFEPEDNTNYNSITEEDNIMYKVSVLQVANKPTEAFCVSNLKYNGKEQTLTKNTPLGYTFKNNKGIDADTYNVIASLDVGYVWEDSTSKEVVINCKIEPVEVNVTWTNEQLVYNGTSQSHTPSVATGIGNEKIILNWDKKVNAGTYTSTARCKSVENGRKCSNYSLTNETNDFAILKANSKILCYDRTYNEKSQTLAFGLGCESIPENSKINAGSYNVTCKGDKNHNDSSATCVINRAKTATTGKCDRPIYNSTDQTLASGGQYIDYSNNIKTNAGNYIVMVKADNNHAFSDDTISKELECELRKRSIKVSTTNQSKTYDGTSLTANDDCSSTGHVQGHMITCSNNSGSITNAGSVEKVIGNIVMKSGTVDVTDNYTIIKVNGMLSVDKRSLNVIADNKEKYHTESNPTLTYTYSNQVSGETPHFTGSLSTTATKNSAINTYKIMQGTLSLIDNGKFLASNYSISFTEGTLTVKNPCTRYTTSCGDWSSCSATYTHQTGVNTRTCTRYSTLLSGYSCGAETDTRNYPTSKSCSGSTDACASTTTSCTSWSSCSVTYTHQTGVKTRTCTRYSSALSGYPCGAETNTASYPTSTSCNGSTDACSSTTRSCGDWGSCSVTYTHQTGVKTRTCTKKSSLVSNHSCGEETDTASCSGSTDACASTTTSCTSWSSCSVTYTHQTGVKTRTCTRYSSALSGYSCGAETNTASYPTSASCNGSTNACSSTTKSCGDWSSCSATYTDESGTKTRTCTKKSSLVSNYSCGTEEETATCTGSTKRVQDCRWSKTGTTSSQGSQCMTDYSSETSNSCSSGSTMNISTVDPYVIKCNGSIVDSNYRGCPSTYSSCKGTFTCEHKGIFQCDVYTCVCS